ncbi:MAG: hypothetical protein IPO86_12770 [Saprospiraceae bacterium]|nr:hypothetical protein [Saprospiraceae bacterium]
MFLLFLPVNILCQRIEFFGFHPAYHHSIDSFNQIEEISKQYINLINSEIKDKKNMPKISKDIFKLIEKIEHSSRFNDDAERIIGFYFKDSSNLVLDVFNLKGRVFIVDNFKRVQFRGDGDSLNLSEVTKKLYDKNDLTFYNEVNKNLFYQYLLPYQAEYYSDSIYSLDLKSTNFYRIDTGKSIKINGTLKPKDIFNEIRKAFSGLSNKLRASPGILDTYDGVSPNNKDFHKLINCNRKYQKFFKEHPLLLNYIKVANSYYIDIKSPKQTDREVKKKRRKQLDDDLFVFMNMVDNKLFSLNDIKFFNSYGLDIYEIRNDLAIKVDKILQCTSSKNLSGEIKYSDDLSNSLLYYYNLIKYCGGEDNYISFTRLESKKNDIYRDLLLKAESYEKEGKYSLALDLLLKAQKIFPYLPSLNIKLKVINDKIANQRDTFPVDIRRNMYVDWVEKLIKGGLNDFVYKIYKYRMPDNDITFNRQGQEIVIVFTPRSNLIDIRSGICYYPLGEFTYDLEEVENSFISNIVYFINQELSLGESNLDKFKPKINIDFIGSADLTNYDGKVAINTEYEYLNEVVKSCNKKEGPYYFQDLCKEDASPWNKNLALGFLRAYHKKAQILAQCAGLISNSDICGKVIQSGNSSNRAVIITIQIVFPSD